MPIVSKAQQRLMFAAKNGETDKVPKKVAEDFINATPKYAFKNLREKVLNKKKPK